MTTAPAGLPAVGMGLGSVGILDRADALRGDEDVLARRLDDPRSRLLLLAEGRVPLLDGPAGSTLALVSPAEAGAGLTDPVLLGVDADDTAYFAATGDLPPGEGIRAAQLREAVVRVGAREAEMVLHAAGVLNWHATHRHCARCGAPTSSVSGGHQRRCPDDGSLHFPRTDPAVIMAVVDTNGRLLLARHNGRYDRYTALAGFVEPGESLEAAVAREVREECDIAIDAVAYVGSQPWPFPSSLMVGFAARASSTDIAVDGIEIDTARWFTPTDLSDAIGDGLVVLTPLSIASLLITRWRNGSLPAL